MAQTVSYQPLILNWESYLQFEKNPTLEGFAKYLLTSSTKKNHDDDAIVPFQEVMTGQTTSYLAPEAAELIFRLNKFINIYGKPIVQEFGLHTMNEFVILASLLELREQSKKELIEDHLIEFTTGMDMLRRMIKNGLLTERVNQKDKRQKLISLSKYGTETLFKILGKLNTINDVLGDLTKEEREAFLKVLKRLNAFHTALHV